MMDPMVISQDNTVVISDIAGVKVVAEGNRDKLISLGESPDLSVAFPEIVKRPAASNRAVMLKVGLKNKHGQMTDPYGNILAVKMYTAALTERNTNLYKQVAMSNVLDNAGSVFTGYKKLVRLDTGVYVAFYKVSSGDTVEELTIELAYVEDYYYTASTITYHFKATQILDAI